MPLLALVCAWSPCAAQTPAAPTSSEKVNSSTVYVARRGWHIDIGMAAGDLEPPLNAAAAGLPGASYLFFGFGDRHYLMARNHNAPVLLSALWPGAGIILATGLRQSPDAGFGVGHVIELTLTPQELAALRNFIWTSLRTESGTLNIYAQGPYEDSLYFLATARYSALHTCNTWAAQALRAAGLHVHTAGVVFASQFWSQVRRLKRAQAAAANSNAAAAAAVSRASLLLESR